MEDLVHDRLEDAHIVVLLFVVKMVNVRRSFVGSDSAQLCYKRQLPSLEANARYLLVVLGFCRHRDFRVASSADAPAAVSAHIALVLTWTHLRMLCPERTFGTSKRYCDQH